MPALSIVIPTYTMAVWLPVALESCLWQSEKDLEIIVVNDGSTDESADIATIYANLDSRVRLVSQANMGHGAARQTGQDAASGKYITFLDADDFLAPNAAAEWLAHTDEGKTQLVCANAVAFSHRTFNARRYFYHPAASGLVFDSSPAYWKSKVLWRWIFSLSFLREHGLTHPRYKRGQDMCFMCDCLVRADSFSQCEANLYYFRQEHKSAVSSVQIQVEHQLAHFLEVKRILLNPPDGKARIKPLIQYLNENFWRDVRKLAPRLAGEDERWLEPALALSVALFAGLDPDWFRGAFLKPELPEQTDFLPLADALIAGDSGTARAVFNHLRVNAPKAPDKKSAFHVLRHKIKSAANPLSWKARASLRELEARAKNNVRKSAG